MLKINKDLKSLRKVSTPAETDEAKQIIRKLKLVLKQTDGIGLCGPQIGIFKRVIVFNTGLYMINPVIVHTYDKESFDYEGCLSIPKTVKKNLKILRPEKVKIKYYTAENTTSWSTFDGIMSRVVQHEIDHLNGVLIIDKENNFDEVINRR